MHDLIRRAAQQPVLEKYLLVTVWKHVRFWYVLVSLPFDTPLFTKTVTLVRPSAEDTSSTEPLASAETASSPNRARALDRRFGTETTRAPWPLPLPNLPTLSKPLLTKNHEIGSCLCRRYQLTQRRTLPHPPTPSARDDAGNLARASAEIRVHTTVPMSLMIDSMQNDASTSGPCLCRKR